jgi:tetratricopeptide (TPR) repeat protein
MNHGRTETDAISLVWVRILLLICVLALAGSWLMHAASVNAIAARGARLCVGGGVFDLLKAARSMTPQERVVEASETAVFLQRVSTRSSQGSAAWRSLIEMHDGDCAGAMRTLQHVEKPRPRLQFLLGLTYHCAGRIEEAQERWLKMEPSGSVLKFALTELAKVGDTAAAVSYCRRWAALSPEDPGRLLQLGEILYCQGNSASAFDAFQEGFARVRDWSSPGATHIVPMHLYHFATLLRSLGRFTEAVGVLKEAVRLHEYPPYMIALAESCESAGSIYEAEQWFSRTITTAPHSGVGFWAYGNFLNRRQRYSEAVEKLQHALQLDPRGPSYYDASLGAAYMAIGRRNEAIDAYRQALRKEPGNRQYEAWVQAAFASKANRGR